MDEFKQDGINIGLEIGLTASAYKVAGTKMLKSRGYDDITPEQFSILFILSLTDGLYQTQIANMLGKDRPNITRMIDILESKNFIRREKDKNNRRILKVFVTEEGRAKTEDIKPLRARLREVERLGLTEEEIEIAVKLIRKIRKNIEESYEIEDI